MRMTMAWLVVGALACAAAGCGGGGDDDGVERLPPSYTITEPSLLVAVGASGTLRVLKQSDLSITATVSLRPRLLPHRLTYNADRSLLAITELAPLAVGMDVPPPGELLVIDPKTGAEKASILTPGGTQNALLLPNMKVVWPERATGLLHFGRLPAAPSFDLVEESNLMVCTTPMEVAITLDNRQLLVACEDTDSLAIVDATTHTKAEVSVGDRPLAAWIGEGGKYYVANQGSKDLSVGAIGQTPVALALGYAPGMVVLSPDGNELAIADREGGRVVIYRTSSQLEVASAATGAGAFGIVWQSDGKKLWVTTEGDGTVVQLDHPSATVLTNEKSMNVGPGAYGIVAVTP